MGLLLFNTEHVASIITAHIQDALRAE